MTEVKKTLIMSAIPITMAECYCPYCEAENSFIWNTTQDFMILQCSKCIKMFEVYKDPKKLPDQIEKEDIYGSVLKRFYELRKYDTYFEDDRAWVKAICKELDERLK